MRRPGRARSLIGRLSLTRQVALLSLLPMIALGLILARVLQGQIVDRTLADATRSARIIARLGVQPSLTPQNLSHGLTAADVQGLDSRLNGPSVGAGPRADQGLELRPQDRLLRGPFPDRQGAGAER